MLNKKMAQLAFKKMCFEKEAILAYSNGEITKRELTKLGVKLEMPLDKKS